MTNGDFSSARDPAQAQLLLLTAVLFVSYLCVAIPLPIIPVYVTGHLGLDNVWAGLGIGIAFLTTIVTRGHAGKLPNCRGTKLAAARGLGFYVAGASMSCIAGVLHHGTGESP